MTEPIPPDEAIEIANRESFVVGPGFTCVSKEAPLNTVELRCIRMVGGVERAHSMYAQRDRSVPMFSAACRDIWAALKRRCEADKPRKVTAEDEADIRWMKAPLTAEEQLAVDEADKP
jgi:hypothetical protein